MGGTMRLGTRPTVFQEGTEGSITRRLHGGAQSVNERHRHRYEINPEYVPVFEEKGLRFVGKDETGERMEIIEMEGHPYFVGCQYHPEYLTRPLKPCPLFRGLILAATGQLDTYLNQQE
jgi:CTP synthase